VVRFLAWIGRLVVVKLEVIWILEYVKLVRKAIIAAGAKR